jgi:ABC-type nitrate/sulfonate/bicarbonate transport system permease component
MAGVDRTARDASAAASRARVQAVAWRVAPFVSVALLIAVWEIVAHSGAVTPYLLPSVGTVLARIWTDAVAGDLWTNMAQTLYRAFAGFAIAAVVGITVGFAMARSRLAYWFFDPLISIGFPMPKIAFLPVIMLWLGTFDVSKISMVVFDAAFPVVTGTLVGIAGVERELIWSARNMGASEREVLRQVVLPAALPQIMTGLQVALPLALIVAVVSEMVMGGYGLGGAMMTAYRFANSAGVFAGIVEIAVVGYMVVKLMALLRRRLLLWHPEALEPSTI